MQGFSLISIPEYSSIYKERGEKSEEQEKLTMKVHVN